MAFFDSFTSALKQKWLEFYQVNRPWLSMHMQVASVKTPDGGRRPPSYFILGSLNGLEPKLAQLMLPFSQLNPDADTLIQVLGLDFDPDLALGLDPNASDMAPVSLESAMASMATATATATATDALSATTVTPPSTPPDSDALSEDSGLEDLAGIAVAGGGIMAAGDAVTSIEVGEFADFDADDDDDLGGLDMDASEDADSEVGEFADFDADDDDDLGGLDMDASEEVELEEGLDDDGLGAFGEDEDESSELEDDGLGAFGDESDELAGLGDLEEDDEDIAELEDSGFGIFGEEESNSLEGLEDLDEDADADDGGLGDLGGLESDDDSDLGGLDGLEGLVTDDDDDLGDLGGLDSDTDDFDTDAFGLTLDDDDDDDDDPEISGLLEELQ